MKTSLILAALLLAASLGHAAPYLVSDPALTSDNITSCVFESFQLPCTLDATKAIRVDLQTLPAGAHSVRAKFCTELWGCSDWSSPFSFSKPVLSGPKNPRLSK